MSSTGEQEVLPLLRGDFYGYEHLLDEDGRALVRRVRDFAEQEIAPIVEDHWARAEFPHELVPKLAALDIVGLGYDRPDRPAASRLLSSFVSMELARVDASIATFFGVHSGLAMGSIVQCGSDEQQARWLPEMFRMEKIGAFALTEPNGGSDVARGLRTTARREGDEWVLDGAKRWIGNATFADHVVVWARDVADDSVKGFVVERGTPGFTATKMEGKLALRIVQNADIVLEGCRVPEADRLQRAESFRDTGRVLRMTRGGVAWSAVGVMIGAYEAASTTPRSASSSAARSPRSSSSRTISRGSSATSRRRSAWRSASRSSRTPTPAATSRPRWPSCSAPSGCARRSPAPASCSAATAFCSRTRWPGSGTTPRPCTRTRARGR